MSIPTRRVSKVVIAGEWFDVEMGTFEVVDMEFTDDDGNPLHGPIDDKAYRFMTTNRDTYYGPLRAIQLIKLFDL